MNENHFTLFTKWRERNKTVPERANCTAKLMRFAVLLCICFFGRELSAQGCVNCGDPVPADQIFQCIEAIPPAEEFLTINPTCSSTATITTILISDMGSGVVGDPRVIQRDYLYDEDGNPATVDDQFTCGTYSFNVIRPNDDDPTITCSPDPLPVSLDSGECDAVVTFHFPTATTTCGGVGIIQTDGTGLVSGDAFPIGITTLTYQAVGYTGATAECEINIEVIGNTPDNAQMNCHEGTNISVSSDGCTAVITPSLILNGEDYACYDDYIVKISQGIPSSAIIGNNTNEVLIDVSQIPGFETTGMSDEFPIEIIWLDENGDQINSCWNGGFMIEDKAAPEICCTDYTISCFDSADP
ncbi:MAG: HYR domain-containing protein, partial [Saprospiraceae bacterium]